MWIERKIAVKFLLVLKPSIHLFARLSHSSSCNTNLREFLTSSKRSIRRNVELHLVGQSLISFFPQRDINFSCFCGRFIFLISAWVCFKRSLNIVTVSKSKRWTTNCRVCEKQLTHLKALKATLCSKLDTSRSMLLPMLLPPSSSTLPLSSCTLFILCPTFAVTELELTAG